VLLVAAMLLAPPSLPIHGGTPFERRTVKAALAHVPAFAPAGTATHPEARAQAAAP